jgi:hypothetical protein
MRVPSVQTKANRAGTVETSSRPARSLSSSPRSPWRRSIFPPKLGCLLAHGSVPVVVIVSLLGPGAGWDAPMHGGTPLGQLAGGVPRP